VVRTLGAEFVHDPWNCFVTVLPFGLMVMLTWAMACGDRWALPVGAGVATYLAQTHVGFVPLALPLLAGGAVTLAASALRSPAASWAASPADDLAPPPAGRGPAGEAVPAVTTPGAHPVPAADPAPARALGLLRRTAAGPRWAAGALGRAGLARPAAVTAGVLAVMWLPPFVDVVLHAPSNLREIAEWFGDADEGVHTVGEGWRTVTGQFGGRPEWLVTKLTPSLGGESPFLYRAPLPWLLLPVAAAGVGLWRGRADGRRLVAVLCATLLLGIAAVARTVGPAYDYRLRWTWLAPMLATVAAAWALWRGLVRRRPRPPGGCRVARWRRSSP